jgi:methoxymalonate biosynthesis acyl carrier protein
VTAERTSELTPVTPDAIASELLSFLARRLKTEVALDQDLFKSGLVSSMFAMELVVHLEEANGIAIIGPELKLDNFRTVRSMTALVLRLRGTSAEADD